MQASASNLRAHPRTGEQIIAELHTRISEDIRRHGVPTPQSEDTPPSAEQQRRVIALRGVVDSCVKELVLNQNRAALGEQRARTIMRELRVVDTTVKEFAGFVREHTGELRATRELHKLSVSPIPTCPDVIELLAKAKASLHLPGSGIIDPSNAPQDAFVLLTRFRSFPERTEPIRKALADLHGRAVAFSKDAKERLRQYDELRSEAKGLRERLDRAESKGGGQAAERFRQRLAKIETRQLTLPAEDEVREALQSEMNTIIERFAETYRQVAEEMTLGSFDPKDSIELTIEAKGLSPLGARIALASALLKRELLTIDPSCSPLDPSLTRLDHLRSLLHRMHYGDERAACVMNEWGDFRETLLLVTSIITLTNPADIPVPEFVTKVQEHWLGGTHGTDLAAINPLLTSCFDRVAKHVRMRMAPSLRHEG